MPDAGWYPDPHDSGNLRWWDGTRWTDRVHKSAPVKPPAAPAQPQATEKVDDEQPPSPPPAAPADLAHPETRHSLGIGRRQLLLIGIAIIVIIIAVIVFAGSGGGDNSKDQSSSDNVHVVRSSSQFSERKKTADQIAKQDLDSVYTVIKVVKSSNQGHYPDKAALLKQLKAMHTGLAIVIGKNPKAVPGKLVILKSSPDQIKVARASTVGGTVFTLTADKNKVTVTP